MKNLMQKIANIQRDLNPIVKDQQNPHFRNRYFDVNTVIEVLKPLLEKYGLVVIQPLSTIDGKQAINTIVFDVDSGEKLESDTPLPATPDAQKAGAAITYFRRYALTSLFLIQGEEDDDGNSAVNSTLTKPNTFKPADLNTPPF